MSDQIPADAKFEETGKRLGIKATIRVEKVLQKGAFCDEFDS